MSERRVAVDSARLEKVKRIGATAGVVALRGLGVLTGVAVVVTGAVAAGYEILNALSLNTVPADELGDMVRSVAPGNGFVGFAGGVVEVVTTPLAAASDLMPDETGAELFAETAAEIAIGATGAMAMELGAILAINSADPNS